MRDYMVMSKLHLKTALVVVCVEKLFVAVNKIDGTKWLIFNLSSSTNFLECSVRNFDFWKMANTVKGTSSFVQNQHLLTKEEDRMKQGDKMHKIPNP